MVMVRTAREPAEPTSAARKVASAAPILGCRGRKDGNSVELRSWEEAGQDAEAKLAKSNAQSRQILELQLFAILSLLFTNV